MGAVANLPPHPGAAVSVVINGITYPRRGFQAAEHVTAFELGAVLVFIGGVVFIGLLAVGAAVFTVAKVLDAIRGR